MSLVKDNIKFSDLETHQEINYHLEQSRYHLDQWVKSIDEVKYHWKKLIEHERLSLHLKNNLNAEASHVL